MPYTLIYPDSYIRRARKFLSKHPEIHSQYRKTLELLELNPYHPSLRLHSLQRSFKRFILNINQYELSDRVGFGDSG